MADYKLLGPDESAGIQRNIDSACIPNDNNNSDWKAYLIWKAIDPINNIPDPQYTTEEQSQIDYDERQNARIDNLKAALINQFKMILELYQVGRDKGLWVVADFDPALVTLAQEWKDLIDDYEADSP